MVALLKRFQGGRQSSSCIEEGTWQKELFELEAEKTAVQVAFGTIEFDPRGTVLGANQAFLDVVGYTADEIVGRHHRMFLHDADANSREYVNFWERLQAGESFRGEFRRIKRDGTIVWLQACYMPVFNKERRVVKVVKYASNITDDKREALIAESKLNAISRSQAVIEFDLQGNILSANELFLKATGYRLEEIQGMHHRIFVDPKYRVSSEYAEFWERLRSGEFFAGQFHRVKKDGSSLWIYGIYSPILDDLGRPFRVFKICSDITAQVEMQEKLREAGESVAVSSKQMAATISEIAESVNTTASIAETTSRNASSTSEAITNLEASSTVIQKVVEVIRDLADQTNLLALNASIESARAGEAGRAFAVVATEVKQLANQTAKATEGIESSISSIREQIKSSINLASSIADNVANVSQMMNTIASAVEEQSVAMDGISKTAEVLRAQSH